MIDMTTDSSSRATSPATTVSAVMPGRPTFTRFNDEFRELFDKYVDSLELSRDKAPRQKATKQIARKIGVSEHTVKSWLRPEGGKAAYACPKWRVDMVKLALPPEVTGLSLTERRLISRSLRQLCDMGVLSGSAAKAFEKIGVKG